MTASIGVIETTGLTPAMVALDAMAKASDVRVIQVELNDMLGVIVKFSGALSHVEDAVATGLRVAAQMGGRPVGGVLKRPAESAMPALRSQAEFNPLIQQLNVFEGDAAAPQGRDDPSNPLMNKEQPMALGFIETQGFTAVFEAIDTACKAASVEVVGKEKLGGGYITVVIRGELSAVTAAVEAARQKTGDLGKLVAAHVVARPHESVLKLLSAIAA